MARSEPRIVPPEEAREAERGEIELTRGHYFALAHTAAVLGEQRAAVLAVHKSTKVWRDSTITSGPLGEPIETEDSLYDSGGQLVYAPDVKAVCEGCGVSREVPYPCETARALGVTDGQ